MNHKNEYIKLTQINEVKIKEDMNRAKQAYIFLKKHVFNYTYSFFYKDRNNLKKFTLNISNNDFAHLCGIKYDNGNKNFGKDLLGNRLDWNKVYIKSDGTTSLKLAVISSIHLLFTVQSRIESGGKNLNLVYDKLIRTNKEILGLGCKQLSVEKIVPLSLLNLKTLNRNEKSVQRYKILCVIKKDRQTNLYELVDKVPSFEVENLKIDF